MTRDPLGRAAVLARFADEFMANGGSLPIELPDGCTGVTASLWPEAPHDPGEIHFSMTWPSVTLVCTRSLAGYSMEGGLHRCA